MGPSGETSALCFFSVLDLMNRISPHRFEVTHADKCRASRPTHSSPVLASEVRRLPPRHLGPTGNSMVLTSFLKPEVFIMYSQVRLATNRSEEDALPRTAITGIAHCHPHHTARRRPPPFPPWPSLPPPPLVVLCGTHLDGKNLSSEVTIGE